MDTIHTQGMTTTRALATTAATVLVSAILATLAVLAGMSMQTSTAHAMTTTEGTVTTTTEDYSGGAVEHVAPIEDWSADTSTDGTTTCTPFTADYFDAAVAAGDMDPAMWDDLMVIGWTGHADDGMEALYAPGC